MNLELLDFPRSFFNLTTLLTFGRLRSSLASITMEGFIFDAENASSSWYQSGLHYSGVYGTPCADKVLEVAPQVLPPSTRSLCELIAILILCAPFALTYLITSYGSQNAVAPGNASRQPPMVPYCVPLLGNVLHYLWDTADLASSIM